MELFRCPGTIPLSCHQWTMVTRLLLSLFPSNEESLIWSVAIICCHETDAGTLTSVSRNGNTGLSPNCCHETDVDTLTSVSRNGNTGFSQNSCHDTDAAVYRCVSWQTQDVLFLYLWDSRVRLFLDFKIMCSFLGKTDNMFHYVWHGRYILLAIPQWVLSVSEKLFLHL